MKYVVILLVIAACVWGYLNFFGNSASLNNVKNGTIQSVSKEKTIFGVNNAEKQNNDATQKALNGNY